MNAPRLVGLLALAVVALNGPGTVPCLAQPAESDDRPTIEALLKDGWQIAGYTGADDGWSAFILLRHPDQKHLVQCRADYDVTREKRVQPTVIGCVDEMGDASSEPYIYRWGRRWPALLSRCVELDAGRRSSLPPSSGRWAGGWPHVLTGSERDWFRWAVVERIERWGPFPLLIRTKCRCTGRG